MYRQWWKLASSYVPTTMLHIRNRLKGVLYWCVKALCSIRIACTHFRWPSCCLEVVRRGNVLEQKKEWLRIDHFSRGCYPASNHCGWEKNTHSLSNAHPSNQIKSLNNLIMTRWCLPYPALVLPPEHIPSRTVKTLYNVLKCITEAYCSFKFCVCPL